MRWWSPEKDGQTPIVEVITDPAEVRAARRHWAEVREGKLVQLLNDPSQIHAYDEEGLGILNEQRERSVAALCKLRDDESKPLPARIDAIVALKLLKVRPDAGQLTRFGMVDDDAMLALLRAFHNLFPARPDKEYIPEDYTSLFKAALKSGNQRIRSSAGYIVSWSPLLSVSEDLLAVIRGQSQPELAMLQAAARRCPSREILELLTDAKENPVYLDKGKVVETIATLGQSTNDLTLKQEAAKVCFDYLRTHPDERSYGSEVTESIKLISSTPPLETARAMLVELVRSSAWQLLRPNALERLLEVDPAVATRLSQETGIPCFPKPRPEIGGSEMPIESLAAICVKHGILTESEADAAKAEELATAKDKTAQALGFFHSAKRLCLFEMKPYTCPSRHDLLLLDIARASAGLFRPEAVVEDFKSNESEPAEAGEDDGPGRWVMRRLDQYSLQFIHQDQLYRVAPRDLPRQYDIEAVLAAIHRALEDADVSDRFIPVADTGMAAVLIFAVPFALRAATPELGLFLCDDSFGSA